MDMTEEKKNRLDEGLTAKFLMGRCTEEELRALKARLDASEEDCRELFKLEEIYQLGKLAADDAGPDLAKAEARLAKQLERERRRRLHVSRMRGWMRYAAILAGLLVLGGLGYVTYTNYEESTPLLTVVARDSMKELKLPDGTKVWLNKQTILKYPTAFCAGERRVYLEGEGYFEVERNPACPFIVQSDAMQVKVLGTVFNLKADRSHMSATATLLKGEIEVKGNRNEGMVVLSPGQKAELNGVTRRLIVKQVDTGFENWHNQQFSFDKADIFTIARTLENSYGVKFILAPDIDAYKTYNGVLKKTESVEEVLDQIKLVVPIEYKIVGTSVFLSSKKSI